MDERDGMNRTVGEDEMVPAPEEEAGRSARRRPINLDALIWALVFIWAGLVLLLENLGYLQAITFGGFDMRWGLPFRSTVWTLILLGAGGLVAVDILVRILVPAYRRNVLGYLILGLVLVFLGLGWAELIWPAMLISLGLGLIIHYIRR
jgi:cytochrome c oxidase subunit IV